MENHNRIYWKKGMYITPEHFLETDNYHTAERHLLARFLATRSYGILPDSNFFIEKKIENNRLTIQNIECLAISKNGYIINIEKDTNYQKELALQENSDGNFYVVLSQDYTCTLLNDEKERYIYPKYKLSLQKTTEIIETGIPVLKIVNQQNHWEIDENYIPPVTALNSINLLKKKFEEIYTILQIIVDKIPTDTALYIQIALLHLELKNFSLQNSPEELLLFLKKFCLLMPSHLKTINQEDISFIQQFIDEPYCHYEISRILTHGIKTLNEINRLLDIKPVEEIPEFEIKL